MIDTNSILAYVSADLVTGAVRPSKVSCVQYDAELRVIAVRLLENEKSWHIPAGSEVNVRMKKADGTGVYAPQTYDGNVAFVTLSAQMCGVWGTQTFVVEIVHGDQKVQTAPILLDVKKNPINDETFISTEERETIQQAVAQAQASAEAAQAAVKTAQSIAQTIQEEAQEIQEAIQTARDAAQAAQEAVDKISALELPFQILSQEEYDALDPPASTTLYLVTDGSTARLYYGSIPLTGAASTDEVEGIVSAQLQNHNTTETAHYNLSVDGNNM